MTTDLLPDLLSGVSPEDAAQVLALGSRMRLAPGAVLFPLGSPADSLYLITHGRVSLTLPMQVGGSDEDILVEERGPGETIGWSAMVPPYRFTLEARAPLDAEVLAFSRAALLDYLAARPAVGQIVMRNIASVIGQRLQVFQAMWLREMQRSLHLHAMRAEGAAS
ncbi:MAG TPA: Crp/Fnr family transcriptional regulator [Vicinamibacterales bacterium]|jgi:CRP-like cAMP-binding protein|nr:Crp/Fnr family transcriptional regulator [Vicinamibacterales bacterium]